MSFLKSVLFGHEGNYTILGISVNFEKLPPGFSSSNSDLKGAGFISKCATTLLGSNAFRWASQGYLHVFVHEMSHALTNKAFNSSSIKSIQVNIATSLCLGDTLVKRSIPIPDWKRTINGAAGPMGNIAFSTCKLITAITLKDYLSLPVALIVGGSSIIWISGELLYAYASASAKNDGDFGNIAKRGNAHLSLASAAIIGQLALSVLATIKLAGFFKK